MTIVYYKVFITSLLSEFNLYFLFQLRLYTCFVLTLAICINGFARQEQFILDRNNELPSDNVYCLYTDRLGYLWIGTDKGVVKYNGYIFKKIDLSTGLQDPSVWDFFEDSKGRLWLSRISNEIGYITNDKYTRIYISSPGEFSVYPLYVREHEEGIMFLSINREKNYLCVEKNDTLHVSELVKYLIHSNPVITPGGDILYWHNGWLYEVTRKNQRFAFRKKCRFDRYPNCQLLHEFLLPYKGEHPGKLYVLNTKTCKETVFPFEQNDPIYTHYESNGRNYIITNKNAYIFDRHMQRCRKTPLDSLLSEDQLRDNKIAYLIEGGLWGTCAATTKTGAYLYYDMPVSPDMIPVNLSKFKYTGKDKENKHYWWNRENKTLAQLTPDHKLKYRKLPHTDDIKCIAEYPGNKMIVIGSDINLLDKKTLSISPFKKIKYYVINNSSQAGLLTKATQTKANDFPILGIKCGFYNDSALHFLAMGYAYVRSVCKGDTLINTVVGYGRFKGLLYDSLYKIYIVYSSRSIFVYTADTMFQISEAMLNDAGITRIEMIISDGLYGNIFIKGYDKIVLYNLYTHRSVEIFHHYKSVQAQIYIHRNILAIALKSGILFCKIKGPGQLSDYAFYPNTKELFYKHLYDVTVINEEILLNTDKGLLSFPLPSEHMYRYKTAFFNSKHRFILKYNNELRRIRQGDTIRLDTNKPDIYFDIINPEGIGSLNIQACIGGMDTSWHELESNALRLPGIKAGQYYPLLLKASDNAWESNALSLVLYKVPAFWQTNSGIVLLWVLITVVTLCTIFLVIYYTRKVVSQNHLKKNYLLSLELKAIHAQINPHFIFNTLNTGLYFISENRNKEAFAHISSFSGLLRSYIKSSRNKHILLSDEIENLRNYINLQRARFEDKFDFTIEVGNEILSGETIIPALLLQPFVENAITHGLLHKKGKGHLSIRFFSDNPPNEITCIIDDDGIGRDEAAQINRNNPNKPPSYGNELIADLIKLINAERMMSVGIDYIDKTGPVTGTTVVITIKKNKS